MLASTVAIRGCGVPCFQSSEVHHQAFPKADKQREHGGHSTKDAHDLGEDISVPVEWKADGRANESEAEEDAGRRFDPAKACTETLVAFSAFHFYQQALR